MNKIYFSCPCCGEVISDAQSACPHCKTAYSDKISVVRQLSVWNLIGLIMGVIVIFMGIGTINEGGIAVATPSASFGGDFYTYIYDAVKDANYILRYLSEDIMFGIGMLIISLGFFMVCFFLRHLIQKQLIYKNTGNYAKENFAQSEPDASPSSVQIIEENLTETIIEDKENHD